MLVLSRKPNETVEILGGQIVVHVFEVQGDRVKLGFEADPDIDINRGEVAQAIRDEFAEARKAEQEARETEAAATDAGAA